MRVVKFKKEHLVGIESREEPTDPMWPNLIECGEKFAKGFSWTLLDNDGAVTACGGAIMLHSKMAEGWAITTPDIERHTLAFHRAFLDGIRIIFSVHKIQRLQIAVKLEWDKAVKWAYRLGFEGEGIMTAFDPDGADYIRLAIVRR